MKDMNLLNKFYLALFTLITLATAYKIVRYYGAPRYYYTASFTAPRTYPVYIHNSYFLLPHHETAAISDDNVNDQRGTYWGAIDFGGEADGKQQLPLKLVMVAKTAAEDAEVTVWIAGAEKLVNTYIPSGILHGFNFLNGYGSGSVTLHLKKQEIKLKAFLELSDEMAAVIKKIKHKNLNKKFLRYINENKMIGYAAYSMDSKAYLKEYPQLLNKIYGANYADEVGMATDLFSLLLDEEAVSKVLKGDALFVFNGLIQR